MALTCGAYSELRSIRKHAQLALSCSAYADMRNLRERAVHTPNMPSMCCLAVHTQTCQLG